MMTERDFAAADRLAARHFVDAMADATPRVIYLGGIVPCGGTVSGHLRSRGRRCLARWGGFVTPIPNRLAVPLVQGIVTSVTADTRRAAQLFPDITPMPYQEAVTLALRSG
ncbi:MAG TPA: hypothetical protein VNU46_08505 [Gemmatimonadaceae bacterium]|jgi:hypothetical protein|nr:hypothetical protein [Gemmatimonadaceae bacterium]